MIALLLLLSEPAFQHSTHLALEPKLECSSCHPARPDWSTERPGARDHAPCDGCHAEAFYREPGPFCLDCHTKVDPRTRGGSPLAELPRRARDAALVVGFSHERHLALPESGRCEGCHLPADRGEMAIPSHAACASCHAERVAPRMADCGGCHARLGHAAARAYAKNDVRFDHAAHRAGPEECEGCHAGTRERDAARLPPMRACVDCHDDGARAPDRVRIARCDGCHLDPARLARPRPSSHEGPPALDRDRAPEDHTPLFRTRHGAAAADPDAKCQFCHAGLSGSRRDACADCHLTTRPRSHGLRFQGPRHGRLAAERPAACRVCHELEQCSECHSIAPPSHSPLAAFVRRHALRARSNVRSCLGCHSFEESCARCHSAELGGTR